MACRQCAEGKTVEGNCASGKTDTERKATQKEVRVGSDDKEIEGGDEQ